MSHAKDISKKVQDHWASFLNKTSLSLVGIARVIRRPAYAGIALCVVGVFATVMAIFLNGTTEWNLLLSSLPLGDKMDIMGRVWVRFFENIPTVQGILVSIAIILQGLTIATLVFNIKKERETNKRYGNSMNRINQSTFATLLTTLSLGCSTCGGSLLIPLLSVVSTSTAFLGTMTILITVLAINVLLYSLWRLGYGAYAHTSMESFLNKENSNG